jgi:hypothetical protein
MAKTFMQQIAALPGFAPNLTIHVGHWLKITRPDGSVVRVRVFDYGATDTQPYIDHSTNVSDVTNTGINNNPNLTQTPKYTDTFGIGLIKAHSESKHTLSWYNCYSFGNGVESNRVDDVFNKIHLTPGARVSTVFEDYKEEHRKYGLIYSGLYNSIGGVNNLNQFIAAEKITKDINPIYGSIQKLHTRDTDLITLCEDKVLKIMANKDAVYNADGNLQLTATENVLGQAVPFVGEYGISRNPESFVTEAYRSYFTDKQRGAVLRLSRDGLTPISEHGMKDWFRDNLKITNTIVGSYDDRNDEYNITLKDRVIDGKSSPTTVSFREDVKGWVSFKSFTPENAISCANDYFTINEGKLYKHYDETVDRNTFYGYYNNSSLNVVLNDSPGSIKSFHTLDYEGSDSRVEGIKTITVNRRVMSPPTGRYFEIESEEDFNYIKHFTNATESTSSSGARKITPFIKQYRNNILIKTGTISVYYPTAASGTFTPHGQFNNWNAGDWRDGDVITTEQQEETVNHFNSMPKDGWYVSEFTTDKDKGSLPEFIEKEGKWFNYVKGVETNIDNHTNFGDFDIQGVGIVQEVNNDDITFTNVINSSLQVGDTLYSEALSVVLGDEWVNFINWLAGFPSTLANWQVTDANTVEWNNLGISAGMHMFTNPSTGGMIQGEKYRIRLEVNNYSGSGTVGLLPLGGVPSSLMVDSNGEYIEDFIYTGGLMGLGAQHSNTATITISIKRVMTGNTLGFARIEADKLIRAGIVTEINNNNNTVTIDSNSVEVVSDVSLISGSNPGNHPNGHYFYFDTKEEMNNLFGGNLPWKRWLGGDTINIKQYRNNILISTGQIRVFDDATHGLLGRYNYHPQAPAGGDWQIGDIISTIPSEQDYVFFVKNQVINKTSLKGYYADVKLENNSRDKIEIFSLNSEITESSK